MTLEKKLLNSVKKNNWYGHYRVYNVTENFLAKRYNRKKNAEHEFEMAKILAKNKINVPIVYNILYLYHHVQKNQSFFNFNKKNSFAELKYYLLMEKIQGKKITSLKNKERKDAEEKFRTQFNKVLNLGILPLDIEFEGNSLYNVQEKKVYLIDFEQWIHFQKNPINSYIDSKFKETYEMINSQPVNFRLVKC